jgi:hypothetical protein
VLDPGVFRVDFMPPTIVQVPRVTTTRREFDDGACPPAARSSDAGFLARPQDWKISAGMRIQALLLALVVVGCAEKGERPSEVVENYLHARDRASCQYLTAPQARLCRLPRVPEPPTRAVVIERVRVHGDQATIRASYEWAGYRRHSTFALIRSDNNWLIARETTD